LGYGQRFRLLSTCKKSFSQKNYVNDDRLITALSLLPHFHQTMSGTAQDTSNAEQGLNLGLLVLGTISSAFFTM
jgi:hypothetical protein